MMHKDYDLFLQWETTGKRDVFGLIKAEFLFRLNPHWVITTFSLKEDSFSVEIADHETNRSTLLEGSYTRDKNGYPHITVENYDWRAIRFFERNGSLHVNVTYAEPPSEEIEKNVVLWMRSIKEYLRLYLKNTINTYFFRYIMNKVILQMTPSQRKISLMLIRVSILEILLIVSILIGWFFFFR